LISDPASRNKPGYQKTDEMILSVDPSSNLVTSITLLAAVEDEEDITVDVYTRGEGSLLDALDEILTEEGK